MKKLLFGLLLSSLILFPSASAMAQEIATEINFMPEPIEDQPMQLFFGQQHNYSVTMRGNGESVVYGKIAFTNFGESDLGSLKFSTEADLYELSAYQQILPDVCKKQVYKKETSSYDCLEYSAPDYYLKESYYYSNQHKDAKYTKLELTQTGNNYEFHLSTKVESNAQGAILLSYRSKDYVTKKAFGLYKFNFTTLEANVKVNDINVAIDVDSDLYLKGEKSTVNYQTFAVSEAVGLGASSSFSNPTLDKTASRIGYYGKLNKSAKDLLAGESFNVNGKYATTKFRLYMMNLIIGAIILILLIVLIYFLNRHFTKKDKAPKLMETEIPETPKQVHDKDSQINLFNGLYLTWSFVASLLLFGLSYSLSLLDNIRWNRVLPNNGEFILVVGFIILVLVYLFLVFGIPVMFASKRGWRAFVSVLLDIVVISAILFAILIAIFVIA
ncbi:hypothetical protein HQ571_01580 [Candidatus Kuenenbacteria bacterium]|nr:hypothetical protein [Candidatus Kuenenbacteria bacterium]